MPHSYDKRKFAWPTGSEQVYYTSRVDSFPNGTTLSNLPDKVFHKQVRESLDKLCDSKKKKWCSLINCLSSLHIEFLKWQTVTRTMQSLLLLVLCFISLPTLSHVTPLPLPESDGSKGRISEYLASVASQRPHTLGTTRSPVYPLDSFGHALNKGNSLNICSHFNGIWKNTQSKHLLAKHVHSG